MVHDRLREDPGLPCSVGVAPNKLLAKLASEMQKPDGFVVISPEEVDGTLKEMPVERLCGVGDRFRENLKGMGIRTCGELAAADFESLYARFGVWGYWLKRMGQGKDESPVSRTDDPDTVKSVGHATTFSRNTRDFSEVRSYLLMLCEKVGFRLRKQGLMGRVVTVTLRYSDYRFRSKQASLREYTDDDIVIYSQGRRIMESLGPFPKAVRLVGVTVSELARDGGQGFLVEMYEKRRQMARAMDRLNGRYGKLTVRHASVDISRKIGFFEPPIPPTIRLLRQRDQ